MTEMFNEVLSKYLEFEENLKQIEENHNIVFNY